MLLMDFGQIFERNRIFTLSRSFFDSLGAGLRGALNIDDTVEVDDIVHLD